MYDVDNDSHADEKDEHPEEGVCSAGFRALLADSRFLHSLIALMTSTAKAACIA